MTFPGADHLAALIERLDWLSRIGARALRITAAAGAVAAVGCWLLIARGWGIIGVLLLIVAFTPAIVLWSYARALDAAVDATKLELSIDEIAGKAVDRVGEVRATLQGGRLRYLHAAWATLTSVRELRADISQFGIDLAAWAAVANPVMLAAVGLSLIAVGGLFGLLAIAALVVLLF